MTRSHLLGPRTAKMLNVRLVAATGLPVGLPLHQRERYRISGRGAHRGLASIRIRKLYNFGNAVRQFVNAINYCLVHDIQALYIPDNNFLVPGNVAGIDILSTPRDQSFAQPALTGTFFYPTLIGIVWNPRTRADILVELRKLIHPKIRQHQKAPDSRTLTVQLRSGDVFLPNPHPDYWPPPLEYFLDAISAPDFEHVLIVAQDLQHPYLESLQHFARARGQGLTVQSSSLSQDIATLLNAQNLCLSQGTFGLAAAWLSDQVLDIRAFGAPDEGELAAMGRPAKITPASAHNGPWLGSAAQIARLMRYDDR